MGVRTSTGAHATAASHEQRILSAAHSMFQERGPAKAVAVALPPHHPATPAAQVMAANASEPQAGLQRFSYFSQTAKPTAQTAAQALM
eukprot:CAMPEP_0183381390 /NCGR_PEP_ID=MMETSP0164_2-20130417/126414_1 /TAXON_ID=221442 /ORGANISM="Coccolithus pelagicus ssp braarudi, Strain PLY182g" /LENGTH=87 /DNA_ID=CAMNT_0025558999 /DNA_START=395 /DNA_END=659 /DNA_ORIENTATION=+